MMSDTYSSIISQAEKAWRQQYAQIVMNLERSVSRERLAASQLEYSIRLNESSVLVCFKVYRLIQRRGSSRIDGDKTDKEDTGETEETGTQQLEKLGAKGEEAGLGTRGRDSL